ncbi:hypothetical protein ABUL04_28965 [Micromonospora harpali]|uniref:MYXO-CTERM domain-containing protein n=2 Tax=Micromonospora TaxID=1873 RepID=A0ABW1HF86_9ACTN
MDLPTPKDTGEGPGREGDMERWVWLTAGSGLLTVVLLTVLAGWGEADATATSGIAAVGTITTAAFGVLALLVRRRGK